MKTICISAGHGAGDPGVVYKNLREEDLTRRIAARTFDIIRLHGIPCLLVPDNLSLIETIQWINNRSIQIGICVEVHINAGGGNGVESWNYQGGPNESDKLGQFLLDALKAESGLPGRGNFDETLNRWKKLGFVHDTNPIAALVECGFIDGNYEFLNSAAGIEKMARGVARGSLSYLGYAWRTELLDKQKITKDEALTRIRSLAESRTSVESRLLKDIFNQL